MLDVRFPGLALFAALMAGLFVVDETRADDADDSIEQARQAVSDMVVATPDAEAAKQRILNESVSDDSEESDE